jgi:diguanylate cyclase (GGDEF)-like protein
MRASADSTLQNVTLPSRGPGRLALLLVVLTGVATTVTLGSVAAYSWYGEIQSRVETIHPAVLDWSVESVRMRLESASTGIADLARASGEAASGSARDARAQQVLASSPVLAGVVFLDGQGRVEGASGGGASFDSLVAILRTDGAVKAGLEEGMAAAEIRRKLASVDTTAMHLIEVEGRSAIVVSAPLRSGSGTLHTLVREAELTAALRTDLLGIGSVRLAGPDGRVIAEAGDVTPGRVSLDAIHAPATPQLNVPWNTDDAWTVHSALPVGVLDLAVVAEQPVLLAFESMVLAAVQMVAAGAVVVVVFTLIASMIAVRTTRRLQRLLDGIREVAKLDFSFRLDSEGLGGQLGFVYRVFNEMAARLAKNSQQADAKLDAMSKQNVGFQKQHEVLAKRSITDGLTQLYNHRHFQDQLVREIKRLSRTNEGLSILIIDIDDFKKLNDTYGHAAGDEFLKQLASILKESVRETDLLARYGGEEFVVVAVGTAVDGAHLLAEKLRTRIAETSFIVDDSKRPRGVTVSIGVAEFGHSRTELFAAADAALYRAKAAGKNCVVVAERMGEEHGPK